MWTHFWDMHSGGGNKEKWHHIYIQAPEEEAKIIFYNRFGHSPDRVSCTCCGEDYSVSSEKTLKQLTAYHRNCQSIERKDGKNFKRSCYLEKGDKMPRGFQKSRFSIFGEYQSLMKYAKSEGVLIISERNIKKEERKGSVPEQGYVWRD